MSFQTTFPQGVSEARGGCKQDVEVGHLLLEDDNGTQGERIVFLHLGVNNGSGSFPMERRAGKEGSFRLSEHLAWQPQSDLRSPVSHGLPAGHCQVLGPGGDTGTNLVPSANLAWYNGRNMNACLAQLGGWRPFTPSATNRSPAAASPTANSSAASTDRECPSARLSMDLSMPNLEFRAGGGGGATSASPLLTPPGGQATPIEGDSCHQSWGVMTPTRRRADGGAVPRSHDSVGGHSLGGGQLLPPHPRPFGESAGQVSPFMEGKSGRAPPPGRSSVSRAYVRSKARRQLSHALLRGLWRWREGLQARKRRRRNGHGSSGSGRSSEPSGHRHPGSDVVLSTPTGTAPMSKRTLPTPPFCNFRPGGGSLGGSLGGTGTDSSGELYYSSGGASRLGWEDGARLSMGQRREDRSGYGSSYGGGSVDARAEEWFHRFLNGEFAQYGGESGYGSELGYGGDGEDGDGDDFEDGLGNLRGGEGSFGGGEMMDTVSSALRGEGKESLASGTATEGERKCEGEGEKEQKGWGTEARERGGEVKLAGLGRFASLPSQLDLEIEAMMAVENGTEKALEMLNGSHMRMRRLQHRMRRRKKNWGEVEAYMCGARSMAGKGRRHGHGEDGCWVNGVQIGGVGGVKLKGPLGWGGGGSGYEDEGTGEDDDSGDADKDARMVIAPEDLQVCRGNLRDGMVGGGVKERDDEEGDGMAGMEMEKGESDGVLKD